MYRYSYRGGPHRAARGGRGQVRREQLPRCMRPLQPRAEAGAVERAAIAAARVALVIVDMGGLLLPSVLLVIVAFTFLTH